MKSKIIGCLLLIISQLIGCAHGRAIVHVDCPGYPIMIKVRVENGIIKGKEVTHAIENNETLWQYIHTIEKTGCVRQ